MYLRRKATKRFLKLEIELKNIQKKVQRPVKFETVQRGRGFRIIDVKQYVNGDMKAHITGMRFIYYYNLSSLVPISYSMNAWGFVRNGRMLDRSQLVLFAENWIRCIMRSYGLT